MLRDLRYAIRFLWTHKGFTAAAVLTLAIGLGANTALFGMLDMALRPLPVPHPEQIVAVAAEMKDDDTGGFQYLFSHEAMKDFQRRAEPFSDVFGMMPRIGGMSADGAAAQFWFTAVSDNYFAALGVKASSGTLFTTSSGAPAAIVLGHTFWQKKFGGDPGVIGRGVRVDGRPAVITGVVEPAFRGTLLGVEMDGYVTFDDYALIEPDVKGWFFNNRKARAINMFARLKPGVTAGEAETSVNGLMAALENEHPESERGVRARVVPEPLARPLPMRVVTEVIPLVQSFGFVVAALVLLLACMNVANLLLVRASAREREMAVRAALGASRGRLVRQMVTEGLVLSVLGGVAGLALGQWVTSAFVARLDLGADLPLSLDAAFNLRVFLFSLAAAVLTGVAIGLWPAWRASRADARAALHDGGKSNSDGTNRQHVRRLLVIGQIAGSLALLIVAGLFVRSLVTAQRIDLGFDVEHLLAVRLDPKQIGYTPERSHELYSELQRRVAAWPEVAATAVSFTTPMSYLIGGGAVYFEGQQLPASGQPPALFFGRVGHKYFDTVGIPIVRGRGFVKNDEPDHEINRQVVIVNETLAARFWPSENPIGKRLRVYNETGPWLEVVGVARDSKYVLIFEEPRPFIYLPIDRDASLATLLVRTHGDPALLAPRLEREIHDVAPGLPVADLRTMHQSLAGIFGFLVFRVGAIQAGGAGLLGLILAIVGVYGVVSFGASLRTREIGIRIALGAQSHDVLHLILGQGIQLVAAGLVIGLAGAVALSRVLARILPLVNAADWVTFVLIALGLGALAIWACYVPARRATKVSAMTALRHE